MVAAVEFAEAAEWEAVEDLQKLVTEIRRFRSDQGLADRQKVPARLSRVTEAMRAVSTDAATVATNAGQPVNTTHAVLIALAWCAGSVVIFGALAPRVFGRTA